jgi:hypothetical protein
VHVVRGIPVTALQDIQRLFSVSEKQCFPVGKVNVIYLSIRRALLNIKRSRPSSVLVIAIGRMRGNAGIATAKFSEPVLIGVRTRVAGP